MQSVIERMSAFGVIPVVRIDDAANAVPLAKALADGGLPCAEITFRTAAAEEAIRQIAANVPDFMIIAGTVLTPAQADAAIAAGAVGLVSPGFNPAVVRHCLDKGYPIAPGVCTPSEVEQAMAMGLTYLKFFPAEAAGGVAMIKAMAAPYGAVKFMPTGGVSLANLPGYLACKAVFACGGSFMVPPDKINNGEFDEITRITRDAVALVKAAREGGKN